MSEKDVLDPEYWEGLERAATAGTELISIYDCEEDPARNHVEPTSYEELRDLSHENNPYGYILNKLEEKVTDEEIFGHFGFTEPKEVSEILVKLSKNGSPHQNPLCKNGLQEDTEVELKTKVESLHNYVENSLGETDQEGVDMSYGKAAEAQQNMLEEAKALERIFSEAITKI